MPYLGNIRGCLEKYGDFAGTHKWVLKASTELTPDRFQHFLLQFSIYLSKEGERFADQVYVILAQFEPETVANLLLTNEHAARMDRVSLALAHVSRECAERMQATIAMRVAAMEDQRRAELERAAEAARQTTLRREEAQRRLVEEQRAREEQARLLQDRRVKAEQEAERQRESEKQRQVDVMRHYHVEYVEHITHIDNVEGILRDGLLARNRIGAPCVDIADVDVNARRDRIEPVYRQNIHDYVPFYFNAINPMLSRRRDLIAQLTILHVATAPIILTDRRWVLSDGNAAVGSTSFFGLVEQMDKLDWCCLRAKYWNDIPGGKRTRCAEMLVEAQVPTTWIVQIDCFSKATMGRVLALTEGIGVIRVVGRANPFP